MNVLLEYIVNFSQTLVIMLAFCLATHYAQNCAGIIGWSLARPVAIATVIRSKEFYITFYTTSI